MARSVKPPAELGPSGRRLWTSCLRRDDSLAESDNPMREVLADACRATDHIEVMERVLAAEGLMVTTMQGDAKAHPMLSEVGKTMSLKARLLVSLRMPDEVTGSKPQRRGLRAQGASKPGGRSSVTSLDRARARAGGA